jgi:Ras-related protein Rab-1A
LKVGAQVEAKHPEKAQFLEAVINKIQDCSQYTVGKKSHHKL